MFWVSGETRILTSANGFANRKSASAEVSPSSKTFPSRVNSMRTFGSSSVARVAGEAALPGADFDRGADLVAIAPLALGAGFELAVAFFSTRGAHRPTNASLVLSSAPKVAN